jgi:hypothetical protein
MTGSIPGKILNFVAIALSAMWLPGCAILKHASIENKEGYYPEVGVRSSANVGAVMVSKYDYTAEEVAILSESPDSSVMSGRPAVPGDAELVKIVSPIGVLYCYPYPAVPDLCFKDQNKDGKFDYVYTIAALGKVAPVGPLEPIAYRVADTASTDGFKYELVYQGVDNGTLQLAYREYQGNSARPALQQDLTYALEDGDTKVSFKHVRLTIHSAGSGQVEYTVDSGFE